MLKQPEKPDISILTTAMVAACITVKEVSQGVTGATNPTWIVGDSESTNPGLWDTTTPFVHNLTTNQSDDITDIGKESRDVNVNNDTFWCIQGIGGYESTPFEDYDYDDDCWLGHAALNDTGVFIIYQEAIRDVVTTNIDVKRNELELNKLVTFHEVLHLFGFIDKDETGYDSKADGPIMNGPEIQVANTITAYETLSPHQIRKIQSKDYPR